MLNFDRRHVLKLLAAAAAAMPAPAFGEAATPAAYPDSTDGLRRLMTDIFAATRAGDGGKAGGLIRALVLPGYEGWFKSVFGDEAGAKLARDYAAQLPRLERELGKLFARVVKEGQSDIRVLRFERSPDRQAVGNQNTAMAAMKKPTPIYSVRFIKPGERRGMHIYSFVYVEGGFRLVGKLRAAKST